MRMRLAKEDLVGAIGLLLLVSLFVADDRLPSSPWKRRLIIAAVALVYLGLSVFAVAARRRREREGRIYSRNWCRRCGYDLRATPDRCPEGGTVPEKPGNISTGPNTGF